MIILMLILLSIAVLIRALPYYLVAGSIGTDHWFFKNYVETYRRERIFPPELPQYVPFEQQWYPPLFPILMAKLPAIVFDKYNRVAAMLIDLIRMGFLLYVINRLTASNLYAVGISGLIYALTPILVSYNMQLNPRCLGALFLDVMIVLLIRVYFYEGVNWIWGLIILLSVLILFTHFFTTQTFWFLFFGLGLIFKDWRLIALIPVSILLAMIISKGYYRKIFLLHWDSIFFWHKNKLWLGAHPIRNSPIYGDKDYVSPTLCHKGGIKGLIQYFRGLYGNDPMVWNTLLTAVYAEFYKDVGIQWFVFAWLVLISIFAFSTYFVPPLRCFGEGYLYIYNAAFPAALLCGIIINVLVFDLTAYIILFLGIILSCGGVIVVYRNVISKRYTTIDIDLERVIDYLKGSKKGVVMCLPFHIIEPIAYRTNQQVLFGGGHGYSAKLLQPFFPRLMITFKEAQERYNIQYVVVRRDYVPDSFIADIVYKSVLDFGQYQVFDIGE